MAAMGLIDEASILPRTRAMKKDIHPAYHDLKVIMTDGTEFVTRSTLKADSYRLDIDPKSHPAWTGVHRMVDTAGQLAKFAKRFGSFGLKSGNE